MAYTKLTLKPSNHLRPHGLRKPVAVTALGIVGANYHKDGVLDTAPLIDSDYGAPTHAAPQGSIYLRKNGAAGSRVYINQDSSTTWAAIAGV